MAEKKDHVDSPLYAGQPILLSTTADDFDDDALDADDVNGMFVTVYRGTYEDVVVAETAMTWDASQGRWEYIWDSSLPYDVDGEPVTPAAGTYRALFELEDVEGRRTPKYVRLRLKRRQEVPA